MKLTQLEKIEQLQLKKNRKELYSIDVSNEITGTTLQLDLYANTSEDALLLARRISKRSEKSFITDINLNLTEVKNNKLGLILPWKNPVNKRSVNAAIKMPLKRSFSLIKDISLATKGSNQIQMSTLTDEALQKMKTTCLKHNFVSLLLLFVGVYIYFVGASDTTNNLSVMMCLVVSVTNFIKTRKAQQLIVIEQITRNHIKVNG